MEASCASVRDESKSPVGDNPNVTKFAKLGDFTLRIGTSLNHLS